MLELPTVGIARSVNEHNVELSVFCDWLEGSVLFEDDEELSASQVVDLLCDSGVYKEQDFAWEMVSNAWRELKRRGDYLGIGSPLEIGKLRLKRLGEWRNFSAYSFCIILSYAKWYPKWAGGFGADFTKQGELFEALTKESLNALFPGWEIHSTGWTRTHTSKLGQVVREIAAQLGEPLGEVGLWVDEKKHEAGLDLLCYRPFPDGRVGVPVILLQCASGMHWDGKLHTPRLEIWNKLVSFASEPKKGFAMPYSVSDSEFRRSCTLVNGVFLDRYRLLSPSRVNRDWISAELKTGLVDWLEPRIASLPHLEED